MATRIRRVVWTHGARIALDEALKFIAQDSLTGAWRILQATLEVAASLESLAERGRVVPEIGDSRIREVFVHSYRLIYDVKESEARIITFLHGSRDFARWRQSRQ